jgi:hypothetical protein
MHYLRISVVVDSQESLESVKEALTADLEFSLDGAAKVVNISHDRELASVFVQARSTRTVPEVLTPGVIPFSPEVSAVLEHYHLTLPKPRKGSPPWRVPKKALYGEIQGLPGLRGQIILTNGIKAFLVRGDGTWVDVHWNWFIPDKLEDLPEDIHPPQSKSDKRTTEVFADL